MKNIKAWTVTDEFDGSGCIVFDAHGIAARRIGANELNTEFEEVSCRRAPDFDKYAEAGEVPKIELLKSGWRFECCHCGQYVEDDEQGSLDVAVIRGHHVFCDSGCSEAWDRHVDKINSHFESFKKRITEKNPHLTFVKFSGGWPMYTCKAEFTFPGCTSNGLIADWKGDGEIVATVAQCDIEAWNVFHGDREGISNEPTN